MSAPLDTLRAALASADGLRAVAVQTTDRSDVFMIRNLDQLRRR